MVTQSNRQRLWIIQGVRPTGHDPDRAFSAAKDVQWNGKPMRMAGALVRDRMQDIAVRPSRHRTCFPSATATVKRRGDTLAKPLGRGYRRSMKEGPGPPSDYRRASPTLPAFQRWALVAFGGILTALGLAAVFFTDNEAGSAVAIFTGAVSAIIGLQGTAVRELTMGDNKVVFDRRDNLAEAVTEQAEVAPEAARSLVDGFALADPDARRDPVVSQAMQVVDRSEGYVREIAAHLRNAAGPHATVRLSGGTGGYAIADSRGVIAVQAIYSDIGTLDADQIVKAVARGTQQGGNAVLLVTNARSLTALAERRVEKAGALVHLLQWHPALGSQPITEAVDALRQRLDAAGDQNT
jgi:hypothetical protein